MPNHLLVEPSFRISGVSLPRPKLSSYGRELKLIHIIFLRCVILVACISAIRKGLHKSVKTQLVLVFIS